MSDGVTIRKETNMFEGEIAKKINEIENAEWKTWRQWKKEGRTRWVIDTGVILEAAPDLMVWYVWKYDEEDAEYRYKILPRAHYSYPTLEALLELQAWIHT